jgi:tetratricopeptide (TPR) repeat protein
MGDGVLVYFGYPRAHEDDAERAVRAGLGVIDAVGRLDVKSVELRGRVGIATGLVVVGDLIGEGSAQEQSVFGETPNLAARLQALAEPDTVVIAAGTRRLVGDLFEYRDLGAIEVKGLAAPVPAWQVLRPSIVASRFEALRGSALTRLIGRAEEIDSLLRRWARAKAGDGQIMLISGDAGLGKSRIAAALEERLQGEPHLRLRYFCSPYHQDSALYPFIDQLGRASGFARDDPPASRLEKLEALLARAAPPDEDVALLADLLTLPASERHPLPNLSPQRKKERTLEALIRQLEGLARRQPMVMVFEDAHWIDPTSRELLDLTVERVRTLPVLLIVTFRPEFQPPWIGQPQVSMMTLNRLDRTDRTALVEEIAGGKVLPDGVVTQIAERTDGVPLFVEELTKSVLESGLLREEVDRYVLDYEYPALGIPTSLHTSLLARLDRLGPTAKEIAQVSAAIGRDFSYDLLTGAAQRTEPELRDALNRLVDAGLIFQRGLPPEATFLFKHALVRDAAYSTLLRSQRQTLHARIGHRIARHFPDIVETQPEFLAHHFTEAGLAEAAIDFWQRAGERDLARSANVEAVRHLTKGIELTQSSLSGPQRDRSEFGLQLALGTAIRATRGQGADETLAVFTRARNLMDERATVREQITVLYGLWGVYLITGNQAAAREIAEQCLTLAARHTDAEASALATRSVGLTLFFTGEFVQAATHLRRTFEFCPLGDESVPDLRFAHDHAACASAYLAWTLWTLGYPEQAANAMGRAVARARGIGHVMTTGTVLAARAILNADLGANIGQAEADAEAALAYAMEHKLPQYQFWGRASRGIALVRDGDLRESIEEMRAGMAQAKQIGAVVFRSAHTGHLASAYARNGEPALGLQLINEAIAKLDETEERLFEAELHRIRGELLGDIGHRENGEDALQRALIVARKQQAKLWELRAAASLARLRRDQGRCAEARDLFAPVYGWFTEGFDTPDLKEAKALLDELA